MNDFPDDSAGCHDLIAPLQCTEQLLVLFSLALLRADHDEVDDADDEDELHDDRHERPAARGGTSGLSEEEWHRKSWGRSHSVGVGREW